MKTRGYLCLEMHGNYPTENGNYIAVNAESAYIFNVPKHWVNDVSNFHYSCDYMAGPIPKNYLT